MIDPPSKCTEGGGNRYTTIYECPDSIELSASIEFVSNDKLVKTISAVETFSLTSTHGWEQTIDILAMKMIRDSVKEEILVLTPHYESPYY